MDSKIIEHLDSDIDRLRNKYCPITIQKLEHIAKEEYGVFVVVETPLKILKSKIVSSNNRLYIFYNAPFKKYRPLSLSHEIGHIAAGHFWGHNRGIWEEELEADYFSASLNGVSLEKLKLYCAIDASFILKDLVMLPFIKRREVAKLRRLGVYHLL